MSNIKEELHSTITARGELDRQFARLLIEESSALMSKNLLHILEQHDNDREQQRAEFAAIVKEAISTAVSPLVVEFHGWRADVDPWRAEVDAERASFRRSRDHSIAERQDHTRALQNLVAELEDVRADLRESKDDRAGLRGQLTDIQAAVDQLLARGSDSDA